MLLLDIYFITINDELTDLLRQLLDFLPAKIQSRLFFVTQ